MPFGSSVCCEVAPKEPNAFQRFGACGMWNLYLTHPNPLMLSSLSSALSFDPLILLTSGQNSLSPKRRRSISGQSGWLLICTNMSWLVSKPFALLVLKIRKWDSERQMRERSLWKGRASWLLWQSCKKPSSQRFAFLGGNLSEWKGSSQMGLLVLSSHSLLKII